MLGTELAVEAKDPFLPMFASIFFTPPRSGGNEIGGS
jgi:hypothetical protein